jgi:hypothetical protein
MTTESTTPVVRRSWRSRSSSIHRCPVHGICKPVATRPGKCPHPRCTKALLVSKVTWQSLE